MVAGKPLHTQTLTFFQKSGRTDGTRYTCVVLHIVLVAKRSCSAPLPSPATLFFQRCRHLRDTQNAWRHAKCVETRDGIPKFSRKTSSEPKIHVCCVTLALVAELFCSAPRLSPGHWHAKCVQTGSRNYNARQVLNLSLTLTLLSFLFSPLPNQSIDKDGARHFHWRLRLMQSLYKMHNFFSHAPLAT